MAPRVYPANSTPLPVEFLPVAALVPNPANARKHSSKQISKLAAAIEEFGFNVPIIVDEAGMILAGHARLAAARQLKLATAPCVLLRHLTPAQKVAFAIADNKLGDLSSFDPEALRAQLEEIAKLDFNLELTGFDTAEIDILFDATSAQSDPADLFDLPDLKTPAVSRLGDLWRLDGHQLLCGNALDADCYERVLGAELANMAFTDPPWNVPIQGHVSGRGNSTHDEFAMASGEMSEAEFERFLATVCALLARFSVDGSIHFICMDWRHIGELLFAAKPIYTELKNICVWNKTNAGLGSLYRSQHELVAVFKNGAARHQNNVELGRHGRFRTNVWTAAGANAFSATRADDLAAHPTVKPIGLVADAIRDVSRRGDLVLDPFVGSGTTILAAERSGRRAAAIEIEPRYVDVAIERWQRLTGKAAVLVGEEKAFEAVREARREHEPAPPSPNGKAG